MSENVHSKLRLHSLMGGLAAEFIGKKSVVLSGVDDLARLHRDVSGPEDGFGNIQELAHKNDHTSNRLRSVLLLFTSDFETSSHSVQKPR